MVTVNCSHCKKHILVDENLIVYEKCSECGSPISIQIGEVQLEDLKLVLLLLIRKEGMDILFNEPKRVLNYISDSLSDHSKKDAKLLRELYDSGAYRYFQNNNLGEQQIQAASKTMQSESVVSDEYAYRISELFCDVIRKYKHGLVCSNTEKAWKKILEKSILDKKNNLYFQPDIPKGLLKKLLSYQNDKEDKINESQVVALLSWNGGMLWGTEAIVLTEHHILHAIKGNTKIIPLKGIKDVKTYLVGNGVSIKILTEDDVIMPTDISSSRYNLEPIMKYMLEESKKCR